MGWLSVQKIQDYIDYYGQNDADYQEGHYREIEREVVLLDQYIAGQFAEKRYMLAENHQQSNHDDHAAGDKQYFTQSF